MSNILKIRDENGNFVGIPSIKGDNGKSAYEQAVEGGFAGTEEEFMQILGNLGGVFALQLADTIDAEEHISDKNNPHGVTVEQIGAAISDLKITPLPTPDEPTDIRTFIWQYPTGHYTANAEISTKLMLPIQGVDVNIDWFRCEDARYNGRYGTLIVRQMVVNGKTFMCSIYNTFSYTEWEEFYTKTNKPTALDVGAVSKSGDTMTGDLSITKASLPSISLVKDANNGTLMRHTDHAKTTDFVNTVDGTHTTLSLANETVNALPFLLRIWTNNGSCYNIYGDHNKPTKSYTGNGGSQTVQIGGIGIVAWLVSSNGLQGYVSKNGFMGMNSNGQASNQVASFITFENGVLTLNNGGLCNASGVEYTVQVL